MHSNPSKYLLHIHTLVCKMYGFTLSMQITLYKKIHIVIHRNLQQWSYAFLRSVSITLKDNNTTCKFNIVNIAKRFTRKIFSIPAKARWRRSFSKGILCLSRNHRPYITTTSAPASDDQASDREDNTNVDNYSDTDNQDEQATSPEANEKLSEDPVVSRLITTVAPASGNQQQQHAIGTTSSTSLFDDGHEHERSAVSDVDDTRPVHIPDITSLFTDNPAVTSQARKDSVFDGFETREILRPSASRPVISPSSSSSDIRMEHRESSDYGDLAAETELPNNGLENAHTIGPYDSMPDYANDQPAADTMMKDQDDDSSTILPEAEPAYRYNIKVRTNGKVLDPPSK